MATLSYHFDTAPVRMPAHARRIAIFGASGATGNFAVRHALAAGFHVTAFVRDPRRLPLRHPALRVVQGDVMQPLSLLGVLDGHEAVLCLLGTMPEGAEGRTRRQHGVPVCSLGTANVLAAMRRAGVKRLVVLSSAGVGESRATGRFGMGRLVHAVLRDVMDDKERQESLVRSSDTRWTILRPTRFNAHPASGDIEVGEDLRWGLSTVSRDDVAQVLVQLIDDRSSIGKALTAA
jgi:uncharacterized protein YbjT (DUF2867 family)